MLILISLLRHCRSELNSFLFIPLSIQFMREIEDFPSWMCCCDKGCSSADILAKTAWSNYHIDFIYTAYLRIANCMAMESSSSDSPVLSRVPQAF